MNPTTSTFWRTHEDAHSGNTALKLSFNDRNIWIGCGFDWMNWKTGLTVGSDTRKMTNLNFWIKTQGDHEPLRVQLICNGKVVDTPAHHTKQLILAKYCANC